MTNPEHREAQKEYKIREATPADAEEIARIQYDSWLATYPNQEANITEEDVRLFLGELSKRIEGRKKRLEEPVQNTKTFVAEEAGRVIGFATVEKGKEDKENYLHALYLDLSMVGKGVSSQLFKKILAYVGEDKSAMLEVAAYNERAKAIYEHYGFRESGRKNLEKTINGKVMPLIVMRRPAKE